MRLDKILKEAMGSYGPNTYPAASSPPRKDFIPQKKNANNFNRQQNNDSILAAAPTPESPSSMPWELNHIVDDLVDAFIYLEVAMKKMSNCAKNSKSISDEQKKALLELYRATKDAAMVVKKVGMSIENAGNIAQQPTPDAFVPTSGKKSIKKN